VSLSKDHRPERQPQSRTQKIVMWSVLGVAAAMLVVAIVLFIASGAPLF
jgi:hypothetical protein